MMKYIVLALIIASPAMAETQIITPPLTWKCVGYEFLPGSKLAHDVVIYDDTTSQVLFTGMQGQTFNEGSCIPVPGGHRMRVETK